MNTSSRLPTYFISHGGGPWPYMQGEFRNHFQQLENSLAQIPTELTRKPESILMISAHWLTRELAIMSAAQPPMLYDYGGFPEHTYEVQYPAPGSPQLASRVEALLHGAGFSTQLDEKRGYDHGAFVPLVVMYPDADIPVVQLSLRADMDPADHIKLGRTLAPLRQQGILIIGSGLSYHNLQVFGPAAKQSSTNFDHWLQETLCPLQGRNRADRLIAWEQAPSARSAHPHEDHLLPLMVAVGAAYDEAGECIYHEADFFGGISVSSFRFGRLESADLA